MAAQRLRETIACPLNDLLARLGRRLIEERSRVERRRVGAEEDDAGLEQEDGLG